MYFHKDSSRTQSNKRQIFYQSLHKRVQYLRKPITNCHLLFFTSALYNSRSTSRIKHSSTWIVLKQMYISNIVLNMKTAVHFLYLFIEFSTDDRFKVHDKTELSEPNESEKNQQARATRHIQL